VLEGRAAQQSPCPQGDDPRAKAFRILLQVAVDRLYDQCRILQRNQEAQALCRAVMPHPDGPRPKVPGVDGVDTVRWQSGEDEDALPYMMRLLAAYGFTFADLDGSPVDAARAMPLIRDKLGMVITTVGARQSRGHQALVDTLGKAALNFFDYAPPLHIVYADLGRGFNIGYSKRLSRIRWFPLRLELTTQVKGFTDPPLWSGAIAQLAGLEYEIPAPLREYFVFRLHGRVGVQWSPFAQHCAQDWGVYNTVCHALVVQPGASFALFDRIRVQGSAEYLNPQVFQQNVAAKWDAVYGAGVQLLW
jgi:hypothetical protein